MLSSRKVLLLVRQRLVAGRLGEPAGSETTRTKRKQTGRREGVLLLVRSPGGGGGGGSCKSKWYPGPCRRCCCSVCWLAMALGFGSGFGGLAGWLDRSSQLLVLRSRLFLFGGFHRVEAASMPGEELA